ncbi:MAG: hypothetical protein QHH07_05835, partial [Sedimentisphaerales bacterium]|nr:hypothetical protein [Sedimentisphaerales bacterium]
MRSVISAWLGCLPIVFLLYCASVLASEDSCGIAVVVPAHPPARVTFGAERLIAALRSAGVQAQLTQVTGRSRFIELKLAESKAGQEAFRIQTMPDGNYQITGGPSGLLYGCLQMADRISRDGKLPGGIDISDRPVFELRGVCVGLQLPSVLPGRGTYEYPITPENFPFFYDRQLWIEFLDFLAANRFNCLYLWNGHPFGSLVKLEEYPYALEVPEEIYQRNVETYRFIAQEADRRGIWLIQMFYNIFVSKPLAERHGIPTQHSQSNPLVLDYNRKCIAKFIETYPNVGLLVCLGEALRGQGNQEFWMRQAIIPAVKDGMARLGLEEEPPVIVRAHAVGDMKALMESALQDYKNLYTMAKYNGESLVTDLVRGRWQEIHLDLSRLGSKHVVNIHLLSNLEPFRYGATDFIGRCVLACRDQLGAKGVHLYPLAYWDWPNSPDKTEPRLRQYKRDWIWFEAWGRYLWQPDREKIADQQYWTDRLAGFYGDRRAAGLVLAAYNHAGLCAPMLLRRFGITDGNRQTFSLGMFLDQLVDPGPYGPVSGLWEWYSPPGERLDVYVKKEWAGQPHGGETPVSIIEDTLRLASQASQAIDRAAGLVTKNKQEFARLQNDIHCIELVTKYYAEKARAAILVLRNRYSKDPNDLKAAEVHLARSLDIYRELVKRTSNTYIYANSLQTGHRRIPIRGWQDDRPYFYHWQHMLPLYEKELEDFKARISSPEQARPVSEPGPRLESAPFTLLSDHAQTYHVRVGA